MVENVAEPLISLAVTNPVLCISLAAFAVVSYALYVIALVIKRKD